MIRATQFSTMGGPVGDPWLRAYPQHCITRSYQANMNHTQNIVIDYLRGVIQNIVRYFDP